MQLWGWKEKSCEYGIKIMEKQFFCAEQIQLTDSGKHQARWEHVIWGSGRGAAMSFPIHQALGSQPSCEFTPIRYPPADLPALDALVGPSRGCSGVCYVWARPHCTLLLLVTVPCVRVVSAILELCNYDPKVAKQGRFPADCVTLCPVTTVGFLPLVCDLTSFWQKQSACCNKAGRGSWGVKKVCCCVLLSSRSFCVLVWGLNSVKVPQYEISALHYKG